MFAKRSKECIAIVFMAGCLTAGASQAQTDNADASGWKTIPGGAGTGCATDATPYEFYVHQGDAKKVAIYFQGGGACWNSKNCGLDGRRIFDNSVDDTDRPWKRGQATGIFDVGNPANPLHEFTLVMAPYCTADVHMGVRTVRFESTDGKHLEVNYRGLANSQSVLDWVTHQFANPKVVFVSGSSAGAIPSPVFASQLARHYPGARVVQLGDGAGGYRTGRLAAQLDLWGATRALKHDPLYSEIDVSTANFEQFYTRAAPVRNLQMAQVNTADDAVQLFFLTELGHQVAKLAPLLNGDFAEIRKVDPKFRTYTIPGAVHTILPRAELYTTKVDNVALTKWIGDLVNGKRVGNVGESLLAPAVERLK